MIWSCVAQTITEQRAKLWIERRERQWCCVQVVRCARHANFGQRYLDIATEYVSSRSYGDGETGRSRRPAARSPLLGCRRWADAVFKPQIGESNLSVRERQHRVPGGIQCCSLESVRSFRVRDDLWYTAEGASAPAVGDTDG